MREAINLWVIRLNWNKWVHLFRRPVCNARKGKQVCQICLRCGLAWLFGLRYCSLSFLPLSLELLNWNLIQFFYLPHLLAPNSISIHIHECLHLNLHANFACKVTDFNFLHTYAVWVVGRVGAHVVCSGRDMHEFMALVMNNMRRGLVDAKQIRCQWLIWLILCSFNVACKFSQIAYVLNYGIYLPSPPPIPLHALHPFRSIIGQRAVQISACAGFPFKISWPEVTSQQNCPTYLSKGKKQREGEKER